MEQRSQSFGWLRYLWNNYDRKVLFAIMMNSFNRGGRTVAVAALITIWKQPPYCFDAEFRQLLFSLIYLPQMLTIPMGLWSESFPVAGYVAKPYIIFSSVIQIAFSITVAV